MEPSEITQIYSDENKFIITAEQGDYIGIYFNQQGADQFWRITCPCGVEVVYAVNGLPVVDTPHPCGKPNHWTVKYCADQPAATT